MNDFAVSPPLASTTSTGGGGNNFENKVHAFYLLQMIDRSLDRTRGFLTKIQYQAGCLGVNTADVVCTYVRNGIVERHFTECKTGVSATASDKAFAKAIAGAWADYSIAALDPDSPFALDTDKLVLLYDVESSNKNMTTYKRLLARARDSLSAEDFAAKCQFKNDINILNAIAQIVQLDEAATPAKALWPFLRVLRCNTLQFNSESLADHDRAIEIITRYVADPEDARLVWRGLIQQASELNENGATVDESNLRFVISPELLRKFERAGQQLPIRVAIPSFPWGAPLWAVNELRRQRSPNQPVTAADAASLLRHLRATRIAARLAPDQVVDEFSVLARTIVSGFDERPGSFDDKAALALFITLNLMDKTAQLALAHWASRQAYGRLERHLREVDFTLGSLYEHYHASFAAGAAGAGLSQNTHEDPELRRRAYVDLAYPRIMPYLHERYMGAHVGLPEVPWLDTDRFDDVRHTIGDNFPDYRHPTHDTARWAGNQGVATFQALIRGVRRGCVAQMLDSYTLCTSEATFERLLNVCAELTAHVERGIQCISESDAYILSELSQLLAHSIASEALDYVHGKLVVLPVQPRFPLTRQELINLPFVNHSLAPAFEENAREEHASLFDDGPRASYEDTSMLWTRRTIFADVMLAMTLKAKMFANSASEAAVANMHGIGVSQMQLASLLFDD